MTEEKVHPRELVIGAELVDTPMTYYVVWVDGELARNMLQWNQEPEEGTSGTNRKASPAKVTEYCNAMLGDEWRINPQPVVYSETGWQEDGQQRLKAIVEASKTKPGIRIPLAVCVDAPDAARMVIDIGKRRTSADFLRMHGQTNANILSAALKMLYCYDTIPRTFPESWRRSRWSPQLQLKVLQDNPMLREGVRAATRSRHLLTVVPGAVLWYLIYRSMDDGGERATWFMRGLEKGVNPDELDARYVFREGLARANYTHRDWSSEELLGIGIKAFNAWVTGANDDFTFGLRKNEKYPRIASAAAALPLQKILTEAEHRAIEEAQKAEFEHKKPKDS